MGIAEGDRREDRSSQGRLPTTASDHLRTARVRPPPPADRVSIASERIEKRERLLVLPRTWSLARPNMVTLVAGALLAELSLA